MNMFLLNVVFWESEWNCGGIILLVSTNFTLSVLRRLSRCPVDKDYLNMVYQIFILGYKIHKGVLHGSKI
jgi:hypothetical protein